MPEPNPPREDETRDDFMNRCMSHEGFKNAHPKQKVRLARCFRMWRESKNN